MANQSQTSKNYLLTGATGVLGGRILVELLTQSNAIIYCMMREKDREQSLDRIAKMLDIYDSGGHSKSQMDRVIYLYGDIACNQLDMPLVQYEQFAESIDYVIHCAAKLSLVASYNALEKVNVDGTERLIEFCLEGDTPILYASSFSMIGWELYTEGFVLYEDRYDYGQSFEQLGYEETKYESEKQLNQAAERGLKFVIIRPGNIWGDSKTGCYPLSGTTVKGIYYDMLKTLVETAYAYDSNELFDVTPVDYVAEASLHLIQNIERFSTQTFNLVNPNIITGNEFSKLLRQVGYKMRILSSEEMFSAISEGRMVRGGEPYYSTFLDLLRLLWEDDGHVPEAARYDTTKIRAALQGTGIECPVVDQKIIKIYIDYCVEQGLIPSPENQTVIAEIHDEFEEKIFMEHLYEADL